jgi:pyruvate dehydrogenase E1 component
MTSIRAEDLRTDPEQVAEWVESFDQLVGVGGRHRAASVLHALAQRVAAAGVSAETAIAADYVNTIPVADEPPFVGDEDLERRFRRLIRWNAAVLVHRAQPADIGVGGHIFWSRT